MYAPSRVIAKVGNGIKISILQETTYPFDENIRLTITASRPVRFPLYLRVPGWCETPGLMINGVSSSTRAAAGSYYIIDRKWTDGDKVELSLPMKIKIRKWTKNHNSVSVDRGPLTYSLKIGEKYVREGGTDEWPAWEVHPTTPWNYGLLLNEDNPASSFRLVRKAWPKSDQPFVADAAPIELRAKAKRIPAWRKDHLGLVGRLQPSPVKSDEPAEDVTLIPMGCARLRISAFPAIGSGPDAHEWKEPPKSLPASASHCWDGDTVAALIDKLVQQSSNDQSIPRMTWWPRKGSTEWVQYDFKEPKKISGASVYWFDDTGAGGCRIPKSWRLLYKKNGRWAEVTGADSYGVEKDKFNTVKFESVQTTALRLEASLQADYSAGILEWRVDMKEQDK